MTASRPETSTALERGIALIVAFDHDEPYGTIAELARRVDLPRASVRRALRSLTTLGLVQQDQDGVYALTSRALALGKGYTRRLNLTDLSLPHLQRLAHRARGHACIAVLDGEEIVYVSQMVAASAPASPVRAGSRVPASGTALGRVLLAAAGPERRGVDVASIRRQGYAYVDASDAAGLRSVAVPVRDTTGRTIAALGVSRIRDETPSAETLAELLPVLRHAADVLETDRNASGRAGASRSPA